MTKRAWQGSNDLEAESLPEMDGGFVSRDDEVKLHRAISAPARFGERVFAHHASDPETARGRVDHESRIRNVVSQAGTIRAQDVTADHLAVLLRHISECSLREPIGHRLFPRCVRIVYKRVARSDCRL